MVCIHKSYIVYFEMSVMPIGHGFSFFGHGKVVENRCWKRGGILQNATVIHSEVSNMLSVQCLLTSAMICVQSLLAESQEPLSFIVCIPDWRDPPTEALIRVESSR